MVTSSRAIRFFQPFFPLQHPQNIYRLCDTGNPNVTTAEKMECWKSKLYREREIVTRIFSMKTWVPIEIHDFTLKPFFFPSMMFISCVMIESDRILPHGGEEK